jgi:hypothetical protein
LTDFAGALAGVGSENFGFVMCEAPTDTSMAASMSGIQRENGVRSATPTMYQHFLAASQRGETQGMLRLVLEVEGGGHLVVGNERQPQGGQHTSSQNSGFQKVGKGGNKSMCDS